MSSSRLLANQPAKPNHGEGRWPEQYKRVKRLFERIRTIYHGKDQAVARAYLREQGNSRWWDWGTHSDLNQHFRDEIYSFFIHCYHLKDWIANDPEFKPAMGIEDYINSQPALQMAADVANGLKHLEIAPRRGGLRAFLGIGTSIQGRGMYAVRLQISTSTGPRDAFEVAGECIRDWEEYIELYMLPLLSAVDQREASRVFGHFEKNRVSATHYFPSSS